MTAHIGAVLFSAFFNFFFVYFGAPTLQGVRIERKDKIQHNANVGVFLLNNMGFCLCVFFISVVFLSINQH